MAISTQQIKELREKTGAGVSDIKKALEESGGDMARAKEIIERKLGSTAGKKAGRKTQAGLVGAYIHSNGRIGAMVAIACETDFVARNPAFKEFAHNLSMHVAAMSPAYLSLESVPKEIWQAEKSRAEAEVKSKAKAANIAEALVEDKLKAHFGQLSLLDQPYIKDQDKTVGEVLNEAIGKFGENIKVGSFVRFEI